MSDLATILSKLKNTKRSGDGWAASCPAHEDRHASMTVTESKDGTILVNCHTGCTFDDIVASLGLEKKDFFPPDPDPVVTATYDYTDEEGKLLYQVLRWHPKSFTQRVPDGCGGSINKLGDVRRVLYQLEEIQKAIKSGKIIFVVEGEKDVHTLKDWGFIATCSSGGARGWREEYAGTLCGAKVVLVPDNDSDGAFFADSVAKSLRGKADKVKRIELPGLAEKQDITDWVAAGHTRNELVDLLKQFTIPTTGVVNLADAIKWLKHHTEVPLAPGIDYPWERVTRCTSGMRPGWLTYLAGYTSHGKTAAAMEIAIHAAKKGHRIFFISAEMGPEEIAIRAAQRYGLDTFGFLTGVITSHNKIAADNAFNDEAYGNIEIAYTKKLTEAEEYLEEYKPDLLIVDYLQLLEIGRLSRLEGTTMNSQKLKDIARRRRIPVLCLSQLRRPDPTKTPSPPTIHDLRDSGAIEQDADTVIFVYQARDEDDYAPVILGSFLVAKARMGLLGSVKFVFDGAMQQFIVDPRIMKTKMDERDKWIEQQTALKAQRWHQP